MPTNGKITLCISLSEELDKDILAWCAKQSNVSASFRALVRSHNQYANIMKELQALKSAVDNIQSAPAQETPKRKRKADIPQDILTAIDNL